jgi:predicted DNA-binding protein (MmcQ/YjbR family)
MGALAMTRDIFLSFCSTLELAEVYVPFALDPDTKAARHAGGKWFALLINLSGEDVINLKCDPVHGAFLRGSFEGVIPAYHMNKDHWISVYLERDVPDDLIQKLILDSYQLTAPKRKK